jgi:methionyl-tRNA synthetase
VWPVLPQKSDEMRTQLGLAPLGIRVGLDLLKPTATLLPEQSGPLAPGAPLFPTIDDDRARELLRELTPKPEATATAPSTSSASPVAPLTATSTPTSVTPDQFGLVDLRVGLIRTAERVPKKDKLLKLAVDLGEHEPRTIIAGLALSFRPDDLVGRKVIVVANLAPRDFGKGLVSHGMLLATGPSEKLTLATVDGDALPGAKLK